MLNVRPGRDPFQVHVETDVDVRRPVRELVVAGKHLVAVDIGRIDMIAGEQVFAVDERLLLAGLLHQVHIFGCDTVDRNQERELVGTPCGGHRPEIALGSVVAVEHDGHVDLGTQVVGDLHVHVAAGTERIVALVGRFAQFLQRLVVVVAQQKIVRRDPVAAAHFDGRLVRLLHVT